MARPELKNAISSGLLILDGAMGTQLFERGAEAGVCNDYINISSPDIVKAVHADYLKAGSDAILTNTFGANKFALGRHGYGEKVEQINAAAAALAREVAGDDHYVLGDIGPTGDFLEPLGKLTPKEVKETFSVQAKSLIDSGVDGLIVESMTALDEIKLAVEAAVDAANKLPVFASMSFETGGGDFKTMMGVGVKQFISAVVPLGVAVIGFNCGKMALESYVGLAGLFAVQLHSMGSDVRLLAEPNAGIPEIVDDKTIYKVTPQKFASAIAKIRDAGFTVLGGCCGTGPKYIKSVTRILRK
ncbi:MAG: homocysteine S-methyltransferase family protein [Phycisphaerae bacterium]